MFVTKKGRRCIIKLKTTKQIKNRLVAACTVNSKNRNRILKKYSSFQAFKYLVGQKSKQSKISDIKYSKLG